MVYVMCLFKNQYHYHIITPKYSYQYLPQISSISWAITLCLNCRRKPGITPQKTYNSKQKAGSIQMMVSNDLQTIINLTLLHMPSVCAWVWVRGDYGCIRNPLLGYSSFSKCQEFVKYLVLSSLSHRGNTPPCPFHTRCVSRLRQNLSQSAVSKFSINPYHTHTSPVHWASWFLIEAFWFPPLVLHFLPRWLYFLEAYSSQPGSGF